MICPECSNGFTIASDVLIGMKVVRTRWCPNCKHKWKVIEISRDEYNDLLKANVALTEIKVELNKVLQKEDYA